MFIIVVIIKLLLLLLLLNIAQRAEGAQKMAMDWLHIAASVPDGNVATGWLQLGRCALVLTGLPARAAVAHVTL